MNKKQPQKVQKVTHLLKKGFKMHTFPYVCATFSLLFFQNKLLP